MALPALQPFSLVGGTALSLKYGHRTSIDLDLFFNEGFEHEPILDSLSKSFGEKFDYRGRFNRFGIFCFIENVKVDIVYYPHPIIEAEITEQNIRMYSDADIAAMKVQAILGRGKKKDFWDLAELLQHYSVEQIMDWHKQKYPSQMLAISIPSALTFFDDAEESEEPVSLKGQNWEDVKRLIQGKVRSFLN